MDQIAGHFEAHATRKLKLDYWLSLPPDYDSGADTLPLLFFLHGAGERSDNPAGLDAVKKHGIPKRVEDKDTLPFITVSPQCPADTWWSSHIDTLMALLEHISAAYRVDTKRIYLTGLSMGGMGTWHLAALYPERFAAAVPICGGLHWSYNLERAALRMKDLPLWVFHGAKDDIVPPEESQRLVDALKAVGSKVKFTLYPNATHDSWTKTYANAKLYDWLLQHQTRGG